MPDEITHPVHPVYPHPPPLKEYPAVNDIKTRVTAILSDLYGAPAGTAVGTDTVGSSEGCMLGGMAMKRKWREDRAAQGRRRGVPNIIVGSNVHVAWFKFCDLFDVRVSAQRAAFVARNLSLSPAGNGVYLIPSIPMQPPRTLLTRTTHHHSPHTPPSSLLTRLLLTRPTSHHSFTGRLPRHRRLPAHPRPRALRARHGRRHPRCRRRRHHRHGDRAR